MRFCYILIAIFVSLPSSFAGTNEKIFVPSDVLYWQMVSAYRSYDACEITHSNIWDSNDAIDGDLYWSGRMLNGARLSYRWFLPTIDWKENVVDVVINEISWNAQLPDEDFELIADAPATSKFSPLMSPMYKTHLNYLNTVPALADRRAFCEDAREKYRQAFVDYIADHAATLEFRANINQNKVSVPGLRLKTNE